MCVALLQIMCTLKSNYLTPSWSSPQKLTAFPVWGLGHLTSRFLPPLPHTHTHTNFLCKALKHASSIIYVLNLLSFSLNSLYYYFLKNLFRLDTSALYCGISNPILLNLFKTFDQFLKRGNLWFCLVIVNWLMVPQQNVSGMMKMEWIALYIPHADFQF